MLDVEWDGDERFRVRARGEHGVVLDGDRRAGLSPMESLLASLCGCMGIDVVLILKKMRVEPRSVRMSADAERMDEPPRYYRRVVLSFDIGGNVPREKAERAVKLSADKYCSVLHTLRDDLEITTEVHLSG